MLRSPAAPTALSIETEIVLIQRRLLALGASAPTWHPLHLERVLERTVVQPLRSLQRSARGATARRICNALAKLESDHFASQLIDAAAQLR